MAYEDRWIVCTAEEIRIRGYYFPWGGKRIPYSKIRSVRRVPLSAFRGRARIWGSGNPRYWAHLDPQRPRRHVALVLDLGQTVKPLLTPDDPDAVIAEIRAHTSDVEFRDEDQRGPLI